MTSIREKIMDLPPRSHSTLYKSINSLILRQEGNRSRTIRVWREEEPKFDPLLAKQEITKSIMKIQEVNKDLPLISMPSIMLAELILESDERINAVQVSDGSVEMGVVIYKNWP